MDKIKALEDHSRHVSLLLLVFAVVCSLSCAASDVEDPIELKLKFKKGDSYDEVIRFKIKASAASDDPKLKDKLVQFSADVTGEATLTTAIQSVSQEGIAILAQEFKKITVQGSLMGAAVNYDTEKREKHENPTVRAVLNSLDGFVRGGEMRSRIDGQGRWAFEGGFAAFEGVDYVQGIRILLPKNKVKVGDQWTEEMEITNPNLSKQKLKVKLTQKLEKIETIDQQRCAVITTEECPVLGKGIDVNNGQTLTVDVQCQSYLILDTAAIIRTKGTMDIVLSVQIEKDKTSNVHIKVESDHTRKR